MAYTITISATDAEILTQAEVEGVNEPAPGFFTFKPGEALRIIGKISDTSVPISTAQSLVGRIAAIHGQWLVGRKRAETTEPSLPQDGGLGEHVRDIDDTLSIATVIADAMDDEQKPDEEGDEPAAEATPKSPGRRRKSA